MPLKHLCMLLLSTTLSVFSEECSTDFALVGHDFELSMIQRQLRGIFTILDDCSFKVSKFEVAGPGSDIVWMGSDGLNTFPISGQNILGRESLMDYEANFTLQSGISWDKVKTVSAWDAGLGAALGQTQLSESKVEQPTMMKHCMQLSDRMRLRWTVNDDKTVDLGFEGVLPTDAYMAFGVVAPGVNSRTMGGADSILAGYRGNDHFAVDAYIEGYDECNYGQTGDKLTGVCDDFSWSTGNTSTENVRLQHTQQLEGVTFIRVQRDLNTGDSEFDHPISPDARSNFIWSIGGTELGASDSDKWVWRGPKVKYHGGLHDVNFGEIYGLQLGSPSIERKCEPFEDLDLPSGLSADEISDLDDKEDGFSKYANKLVLGDNDMILFWNLDTESTKDVSFGVRNLKAGKWASIAIGQNMVGSHSYVGFYDDAGTSKVKAYALSSLQATGVKEVAENTTQTTVYQRSNDRISFEFTRSLQGNEDLGVPDINPRDVDIVWAYGKTWRDIPTEFDVHTDRSSLSTKVNLITGQDATASISYLIVIHGLLMWLCWCVCVPGAVMAARYMKAFKNGLWFRIHKNSLLAATAFIAVATILAIVHEYTASRPSIFSEQASLHAKLGVAPLVLLLVQIVWALNKPGFAGPKPTEFDDIKLLEGTDSTNAETNGDSSAKDAPAKDDKTKSDEYTKAVKEWQSRHTKRKVWEASHRFFALACLILSFAAVFTGLEQIVFQGMDADASTRCIIATWIWLGAVVSTIILREFFNYVQVPVADDQKPEPSSSGFKIYAGAMIVLSIFLALYAGGVFLPVAAIELAETDLQQNLPVEAVVAANSSVAFMFKIAGIAQAEANSGMDVIAKSVKKSLGYSNRQPMDLEIADFRAQHHHFRTLEEAVTFSANIRELTADKAISTRDSVNSPEYSDTLTSQLRKDLKIYDLEASVTMPARTSDQIDSVNPTHAPSSTPTSSPPTEKPTNRPTDTPTTSPSQNPSAFPTQTPTQPSISPTNSPTIRGATSAPTFKPTATTGSPTSSPTTSNPTTASPTTSRPTMTPTPQPTIKCGAFPKEYVGDGWCDQQAVFNSIECGWDGGDCCNPNSAIMNCKDPNSPNFGKRTSQLRFPIPRNPRYSIQEDRTVSTYSLVTTYNNFYEFGFSKSISATAQKAGAAFLENMDWKIEITGLVEKPQTITVRELLNQFVIEERLLRHRCVEAWSIIVPWMGIPLASLVQMVQPKAKAKYLRFTTFKNTTVSRVQTTSYPYEWPYVEGITVDEAMNELAFLTVGAYQEQLKAQSGAPIRLTLPWKYGFKSIKSIVKIEFVEERPINFWHKANNKEYGFWANVNPAVDHPRWTQATERPLIDSAYGSSRIPTQLFNGYKDYVAYMYEGLEDTEKLWY